MVIDKNTHLTYHMLMLVFVGSIIYKDGNEVGFFGYPPHPAPNRMGFNFN